MPGSVRGGRPSARRPLVDRAAVGQLRQAEVEDLDAAVAGDEDVLGLEVAVDDALLVRGRQPLRDLQPPSSIALRGGSGPRARARAQRLALEQLGDDVRRAVVRADVEDRDDVRDG